MPCLGRRIKKGRTACCVVGAIVNVIGIILGGALMLHIQLPPIVDGGLKDSFEINSQAAATASNFYQKDGESLATTEYYLYNLTNEADVITGSAAIFERVGPFKYTTYAGKIDSTYNANNATMSYYLRSNMVLDTANSASTAGIITTVDNVYTAMFGAGAQVPTESSLVMSSAVGSAGVIHTYLGDTLLGLQFASEIAGDANYLTTLMATVATNSGETIANTNDLLMLHYGAGGIVCQGANPYGQACGMGAITTSASARGAITATLLGASYLSDAQKSAITTEFASDATFFGIGIYQHMRALSVSMGTPECGALTLAEAKTVMPCLWNPECGLVAAGMIAADFTNLGSAALAMFGLNIADTNHLCYTTALAAYGVSVQPLGNHHFTSRLLKEKDVSSLILEKKTAAQILSGYNSPTLNALGLAAAVPGITVTHTTDDIAINGNSATLGGMQFEVRTKIKELNKITKYQGATGFDFDGDGNLTFIDGLFAGTTFPPNQKGLSFDAFQNTYAIFQAAMYRGCDFEKSDEYTTIGNYKAPKFWRNEETCFAANSSLAINTAGFADLLAITQARMYSTPACMIGHTSGKTWTDDCPSAPTNDEFGSFFAIDSISGVPWAMQSSAQVVFGVDYSASSYDVTASSATNTHFPSFTMKASLELNAADSLLITSNYDLLFLLKDVIAWVLFAIGLAFGLGSNVMIMTSLEKVPVAPKAETELEIKAAATASAPGVTQGKETV